MATNAERNPHYIKGEDLKKQLRLFHSTGVISEELGGMMMKLARKFANKWNFMNYTYKDEFINDAILKMVQYIHKVDPDRNPFCYLTCICESCFRGRIAKETRFGDMKKQLVIMNLDDLEHSEGLNIIQKSDDADENFIDLDDNMDDYDTFRTELLKERKAKQAAERPKRKMFQKKVVPPVDPSLNK